MTCNESIFDVANVRMFPKGVLSYLAPNEILKKTISSSFITGDVASGMLPFSIENGEIKETADSDIGGDYYKVVLSWDITDFSGIVFDKLKSLQGTPHDVLAYSTIGEVMLVRCDSASYKLTHSSKDGITSVELTIINVSGIQFVTE